MSEKSRENIKYAPKTVSKYKSTHNVCVCVCATLYSCGINICVFVYYTWISIRDFLHQFIFIILLLKKVEHASRILSPYTRILHCVRVNELNDVIHANHSLKRIRFLIEWVGEGGTFTFKSTAMCSHSSCIFVL